MIRPKRFLVLPVLLIAFSVLVYPCHARQSVNDQLVDSPQPMDGIPDAYAVLEWKAKLGWGPWGLGIADLSHDGETEILVGNIPGLLRVFNGSSHVELENLSIGASLSGIPVGDLDDDGFQEVVTANDYADSSHAGVVHIFEWTEAGLALEWQSVDLGWEVRDIEIEDVDCDGSLEVILVTLNNGTHAIGYDPNLLSYEVERSSDPFSWTYSLEVAEIDNDPIPEVVVTGSDGLYVLDGETLDTEWSILSSDEPRLRLSYGLAVGDLEQDGDMEIIVGARDGWVIVDPATKSVLAEVPRQSFGLDVGIMDIDRDGEVEFFGTVSQDLNKSGGNYYGYLVVYDGTTLEREWRSPNLWFEGFDNAAGRVEAGNVDHDAHIEVLVSTYGGVFQFEIQSSPKLEIKAQIDCDPDTLNLKSKGNWITCYIELPLGYDPRDVDAGTILLNGVLMPELNPKYGFVRSEDSYIVDHD
ncbi:MAG: hypothetical protein KAW09_12360, partial [Thermoplasmata archaeon]|nr:hypothetical protein [Thermoplasmata archaeon]